MGGGCGANVGEAAGWGCGAGLELGLGSSLSERFD
jgi:hypothetical protein